MDTTDAYEHGLENTRQDFTATHARIARALDCVLTSTQAINGDQVAAGAMTTRVQTVPHLMKQIGRTV